jgi:DNA-binding HxlR family transcriptional regulator
MEWETGMENNTSKHFDEAGCASCSPDPLVLANFQKTVRAIVGKWKFEILFALMDGAMRFGELRRSLGSITQHMLTTQLRELENGGLVLRTAFPGAQMRVEYELTEAAYGLLPVFRELLGWSKLYGRDGGGKSD